MKFQKNILLEGAAGRNFLLDIYAPEVNEAVPLVIFIHGFKGFKDWGHWEAIAMEFVKHGFAFTKFNFSHNGTTIESPSTFDDLEAFGQNNYSKELFDIDQVLQYFLGTDSANFKIDVNAIYLIGHSRGGAISLIKAATDDRIKGVISWAAVSTLDYAWKDDNHMAMWKEKGVQYILNRRTMQEMPMYYQFYEDYLENFKGKETLDLLPTFKKPYLILHGDDDPAIAHQAAEILNTLAPLSKLHIIKGANHVFGGSHPFEGTTLPVHTTELVEESITFLKAHEM